MIYYYFRARKKRATLKRAVFSKCREIKSKFEPLRRRIFKTPKRICTVSMYVYVDVCIMYLCVKL